MYEFLLYSEVLFPLGIQFTLELGNILLSSLTVSLVVLFKHLIVIFHVCDRRVVPLVLHSLYFGPGPFTLVGLSPETHSVPEVVHNVYPFRTLIGP